jgi:hypothetical protein
MTDDQPRKPPRRWRRPISAKAVRRAFIKAHNRHPQNARRNWHRCTAIIVARMGLLAPAGFRPEDKRAARRSLIRPNMAGGLHRPAL